MIGAFIFGLVVLIVGLVSLLVFLGGDKAEPVIGSLMIVLLGIVIICIWAFAPICELVDAETQMIRGERFLISEKVCYRNIRPSKSWNYIYFTELKGKQ